MMLLVTNLGDFLVLAPASVGLIVLLAWAGRIDDALAYAKSLMFCLVAMFALKFALAACGTGRHAFGVVSPSGHVAFASTFYGCLALMMGTGRHWGIRAALYGGAAALTALIAFTRVALEAHTLNETIIGALVGGIAVGLFRFNLPHPEPIHASMFGFARSAAFALVYVACLLLVAQRWTAEPWIDFLAAQFGLAARLCA